MIASQYISTSTDMAFSCTVVIRDSKLMNNVTADMFAEGAAIAQEALKGKSNSIVFERQSMFVGSLTTSM